MSVAQKREMQTRLLMEKPVEEIPLEKSKRNWQDNIKMGIE